MFARKGVFSSIGRAGALATVAAVALTAVVPSKAYAGSASSRMAVTASTGTSDATDFSARRYYRGGYYRGGGGAAAAAMFAVVGTGLAIAAAQSRRDYYGYYGPGYYGGPAYYGRPAYYGGGPYYYGGGPYYGGGYGYR